MGCTLVWLLNPLEAFEASENSARMRHAFVHFLEAAEAMKEHSRMKAS